MFTEEELKKLKNGQLVIVSTLEDGEEPTPHDTEYTFAAILDAEDRDNFELTGGEIGDIIETRTGLLPGCFNTAWEVVSSLEFEEKELQKKGENDNVNA